MFKLHPLSLTGYPLALIGAMVCGGSLAKLQNVSPPHTYDFHYCQTFPTSPPLSPLKGGKGNGVKVRTVNDAIFPHLSALIPHLESMGAETTFNQHRKAIK